MVVDARCANALHHVPPPLRLGSSGAMARLDLSEFRAKQEPLYAASLDLQDCFTSSGTSRSRRGLDASGRRGQATSTCAKSGTTTRRHSGPCPLRTTSPRGAPRGMPMGWSWAMFFCQSAMEQAIERALPASDSHGGLLQEGRPSRTPGRGHPVAAVYVDNAIVVGCGQEETDAALQRMCDALTAVGLAFHELIPATQCIDYVGLTLDLMRLELRNTPKRVWRLRAATSGLMELGGCTPRMMEIYVGHVVHCFMLRPCALSCLRRAYDFLRCKEDGFRKFSPEMMKELATIRGLLIVASVLDLAAPYLEGAMCGDSSMKGYSLSYSAASLEEVQNAARLRERWRFKVVQRDADDIIDEGGRVSEQHAGVGIAVEAATAAGWGVGDDDRRCSRPLARRGRKTELVQACDIQELPPSWSAPGRWRRVVRGAWSRGGVIHDLEGRVVVMGLRRICRVSAAHGCRVLSLTDNMAVAMSLDRGRARDYGLNVLAARAAAYQLGCNVNWVIRYIRSEANATDHDSRAADRGEIAPGGGERGSAEPFPGPSRPDVARCRQEAVARCLAPPPRPTGWMGEHRPRSCMPTCGQKMGSPSLGLGGKCLRWGVLGRGHRSPLLSPSSPPAGLPSVRPIAQARVSAGGRRRGGSSRSRSAHLWGSSRGMVSRPELGP